MLVKAKIIGTAGKIEFDNWWFTPVNFMLSMDGKEDRELQFPPLVNGYEYEIMESVQCLQEGKIESSVMPHEFSLLLMETMDKIRKISGITYPEQIESTEKPYGWDEL